MGSGSHDPLYIILVLFVLAVFAFAQVINAFAAIGPTDSLDWFQSRTADISDKYYTYITPVGWTFTVWGVIYIWQLVWIAFAHVIICVKSATGNPLYTDPPIISPLLLSVYALNNALNIAWLFLFDREEMVWAMVVILTIPATLYFCIGNNCYRIRVHAHQLRISGRKYLICNYLFLQNGLGIYAGWTTVASLLNLSIVLVYFQGLSQENAALVCVCILGVVEIGYFILEVSVLERDLRYLFTPWLVIMFALSGVMVGNWDTGSVSSNLTLALACLAFVFLLCKVGLTVKRTLEDSHRIELEAGMEDGGVTLQKSSLGSRDDGGFDNVAMSDKL